MGETEDRSGREKERERQTRMGERQSGRSGRDRGVRERKIKRDSGWERER